jgi:hypothetical protein
VVPARDSIEELMKRGTLTSIGIAVAAIAVGCGGGNHGGGDARVPGSSPGAIAACFRHEGATSVYRKKEEGVPFVNGLVRGAYAVSAELTGDKAKTEELLERYEARGSAKLEAFEALGGTAVAVIAKEKPATKRIVLNCLGKG